MKLHWLDSRYGRQWGLRLLAPTAALLLAALIVVACLVDSDPGGLDTEAQTPDGATDPPPEGWPDGALARVDAAPSPVPNPDPDPLPTSDCRDHYPQIPWTREFDNECSKCYDCPGEGVLPGIAFITCRIDGQCYRFATVDNCNYDLCPSGSCTFPVHDEMAFCRKDGINYTYFVCRINHKLRPFQTVNATNYFEKSDVAGNMAYDVADALPIVGGCVD